MSFTGRLNAEIMAKVNIRKYVRKKIRLLFLPLFIFAANNNMVGGDTSFLTSHSFSKADQYSLISNIKLNNYNTALKVIGILEDEQDDDLSLDGNDYYFQSLDFGSYPSATPANLFYYRNFLFLSNLAHSPSAFEINRAYLL